MSVVAGDDKGQKVEDAVCKLSKDLNGSFETSVRRCSKQCRATTSFMNDMSIRMRAVRTTALLSGDGNGHR